MRLLLINPRSSESFWNLKWAVDNVLKKKFPIPPLGLATVAALAPEDWEVAVIDENIEAVPREPQADVIGICGMGVQFARQKELLVYYRNKGYFVVAGGSYASLCPELYEPIADTVMAGESEYIFKEFFEDFEKGEPRHLYKETGVVTMADSPVPRFDLLNLSNYMMASLQFSRGCPFRCEFCDIIVMFGRRPRTKSLEQIGRELDELRSLGTHIAFFVDDNFIGNKKAAKQLLRFLKDYQQRHCYKFSFGTEASLNLAYDKELLELFKAANFEWVFVGIESPDEESLRETQKLQNIRQNMLASIRTLYSHGIDVFAGFIIGFDNDTDEIFDKQYRFITQSGIQMAMIALLHAIPKTPLHERLEKEKRLIPHSDTMDNVRVGSNIIPKHMDYDEMISNYRALYRRLLNDRNIADRIRNKMCYFGDNPASGGQYSLGEHLRTFGRVFLHGLAAGGASRMFHFIRTFPFFSPKLFPVAIRDWIIGLSLRDYADRYFAQESE